MKKILLLLFLILIFGTSCKNNDVVDNIDSNDNKDSKKRELNLYLPGDYINPDLVEKFSKETGIKVIMENFENNEDMLVKLEKGGNEYDLVIPSDYMIEKMIKHDTIQKIDYSKIPNYNHIDEHFKTTNFDANNEYSVPYYWGYVGILYNKKYIKEPVDSWKILFDKKYSGKILMLNSTRDSMMIALKYLGYSMNTVNESEIQEAKDLLLKQKPLVLAYGLDDIKEEMVNESAWLLPTYNGEGIVLGKENENLDMAYPKEGSNIWIDSFVIPKNAKNINEAYEFINFMYAPANNVENTLFIGYSTPNKTAYELLDDDLKSNKIAYPNLDELKNSEQFRDLGDDIEIYNRAWTDLKAN